MAGYNKFDPRIESLVMETRTFWDPEVGELPDEDKHWLADMLHRNPQKASRIEYDRSHTGFTRIITVTVDDIARLYEERLTN
ncbi:MAG: hypothetical protein ACREJB_01480 [Planctomycetaceae bacterium]